MAADLCVAGLAVAVAGSRSDQSVLAASAALALLWLVLMAAFRAYDPVPAGTDGTRVRRVLRAGVALGLTSWVLSTVVPDRAAAIHLMAMTSTVTVAALGHRTATRLGRAALRASERRTPVVVVGDPEDVRPVLAELRRSTLWDAVAVCLTRDPSPDAWSITDAVRVGLDDLAGTIADAAAEAVVAVPGRGLDPAKLRRLSWELERTGVQLYLGTGLLDVQVSRATLVRGGDLGMVHVRPSIHAGPIHAVKRALECAFALVALVLLAPLLLIVATAVRVESPGPVLFRQSRVGHHGQHFTMLKFRSMTDGADRLHHDLARRVEPDHVLFKLPCDPRITRVGRFIRRYSLDELPQLVNVVRGEMALVGPRPALPEEVRRYDVDALRRLAARPGLTGLWQVSGRSDLSWEDSVRLDLHYVDNWSLSLDAGILLRTVGTVLGHRGAY